VLALTNAPIVEGDALAPAVPGSVRVGSMRRALRTGVTLPAALLAVGVLLVGASPSLAVRERIASNPYSPVSVFETTFNLSQRLSWAGDVYFGSRRVSHVPIIHVNDGIRYQQVLGFGAALTDSAAWLIYDGLPPSQRAVLLNSLFGTAGIRLNFVRVPMGASDFTVGGEPYSYDDVGPGESDPQLANFSVAHDDAYIVPTLQQMLAINPSIALLASPWTPPAWMKSDQSYDNPDGTATLLPSDYAAFADYFVDFLQAYAARGINVDAITPQNEPQGRSDFPGMTWSAADEADWIVNDLAPALSAAGVHPQIYGWDSGGSPAYPEALLAGAGGALAGIAWHCYGGLGGMSALHAADPGVVEILSECSPGIIPYAVPEVVIGAMRDWASAVELWNLALDPSGGPVQPPNDGCQHCTGLATINEQKGTYQLRLGYYQLGQISSFVEPGAVRVGSDRFVSDYQLGPGKYGVSAGLDDVAFLNPDGSRVLVAYDSAARAARFAVQWHGRAFAFRLAPRETVTFVWTAGS
jgi:glucosylceramidase